MAGLDSGASGGRGPTRPAARWRGSWPQIWRDLQVLTGSMLGRHPPPLLMGDARGRAERADSVPYGADRRSQGSSEPGHAVRDLPQGAEQRQVMGSDAAAWRARIVGMVRETDQAVSLVLEALDLRTIDFRPGQFLTLLVEIDGVLARRAYSISSSSRHPGRVRITSKRVAGGRVSAYLNERAQLGDELNVLGPSGSFTIHPDPRGARHAVLLGGGSGITPLLAIARAVVTEEPASQVSLIYANRSEREIIFAGELAQLEAEHGSRFQVRHVLSDPAQPAAAHRLGLLDQANLEAELARLEGGSDLEPEYFCCGPEPMMAAARAVLGRRGVPPGRLREERFASPGQDSPLVVGSTAPQAVRFVVDGVAREVVVEPGQSLLDAGLRDGLTLPFSCTVGGCGACQAELRSGQVDLRQPNCLSPQERAGGAVLLCSSHPRTAATVEIEL